MITNNDVTIALNKLGIGAESDASRESNEEAINNQCAAEIQVILEKYGRTIEIINDLKIVPQN